ncbi:hypothetical protein D9619_011037 [Psilocybe cf. subviscida]|uniref:Nephrocystin 3-like N-terminal domain-containing protein n=1 Tax=Psilocybe cf. subviscida TaxID=2480587 RepID=A0A8H5B8D6_9AGAR|nr:hypothetical protein D9619_011037 [Psilocybe cf. subviscida]
MASILTGASNITISGGTFSIHQDNSNETGRKSALHPLSQAAAHSALHDAPTRTDQSRCHQHTRTNVLDHLERWAQGICHEGAPIFWLHGGAGAGKSAVMQTLAERCVAQRLALGSFFFSRSDPARNTAEVLIPTLAYQLGQRFPASMDVLGPIIHQDPLIFKKSLQVQVLTLLVCPLQHLVELGVISNAPQAPRIFLIDGLDECDDTIQQQAIVQAVAAVCHEHRIPVKFLIASRPELAISSSFEWYKEENRVLGAISLSKDPDAENDIYRFIEDEFRDIRWKHPFKKMIPPEWPDLYDINRIVWKSSSHFIYASTAMKYIWMAKENPIRSLQVVLGLEVSRTIAPFSELDALYHHILRSAAHIDKVLQILAHCLVSHFPKSSSAISFFLDISKDDLSIFMADVTPLATLVKPEQPSAYPEDDDAVKILHASLGDFLFNQFRSGSLYIDRAAFLASKVEICFQLLDLRPIKPELLGYKSGVWENMRYQALKNQVNQTIQQAGQLSATQEVLRQYNLIKFYRWQLSCIKYIAGSISELLCDLLTFFLSVRSLESHEAVPLYSAYVDDFPNLLRYHISLKSTPVAAAIFTLVSIGHPTQTLCRALESHLDSKFPWYVDMLKSALRALSTAEFALILHNIDTPPERLAVAAEAVLGYLFDARVWPHASQSVYATQQQVLEQFVVLLSLIDTLLWLLPKAGFSWKILRYSKRQLLGDGPLKIDQNRISQVEKCLDEYTSRVQDVKLEELRKRIEAGDVTALIEKAHMLYLDDQD